MLLGGVGSRDLLLLALPASQRSNHGGGGGGEGAHNTACCRDCNAQRRRARATPTEATAYADLGAGPTLPDQTAALKRRAEERDARPGSRAFEWLIKNHNYSTMVAAATRIEQLVIERYLRITSAELEELWLWSLDHCADEVAKWRGRAAPTDIDEFTPITADVVAAIEAALPAMRAELAAIESDADVAAGILKWRHGEREWECGEPGHRDDERELNNMAASVCKTPNELRITTAMLRAYAAQLSARDSARAADGDGERWPRPAPPLRRAAAPGRRRSRRR